MDTAEAAAEAYLRSKYCNVVYEPDGNIPPDFLVEGRIAVEVRRLNQNSGDEEGYRGLEEVSIPLHHKMKNLLKSFGGTAAERSWFVMYRFSRPVPKWNDIASEIRRILLNHIEHPSEGLTEYKVHENFKISVAAGAQKYDSHYRLGSYSDSDSGGWLLAELQRNLEICMTEKARKIAAHRHKYDEWWLILVDHIAYALDELDREIWDDRPIKRNDWNRVVLIDPRGKNDPYEI
jgi:hypothetical protein